MKRLLLAAIVSALGVVACKSPPTQVPVGEVVTTQREYALVQSGPGAELCADLPRAQEAIRQGLLTEAEALLTGMIDAFAALEEARGVPLIAFANQDEYEQYRASSGVSTPFEPVDWCYRELFQLRAFIAAGREDYLSALTALDRAIEVGPTAAAPYVERGYVFNRMRSFEKARDSYNRALHLGEQYPASAPQRPLALRGLGFALIELGDLDAAERAFEESLILEPDNALAKNELRYIEHLRAQGR